MTEVGSVNLDHLLKLRLVVARFGEMDVRKWWNSNGVLARNGQLLMSRGFSKTHFFAQARVALEIARSRSDERFSDVNGCITLWELPAELEEDFDAAWSDWINQDEIVAFLRDLQEINSASKLIETLKNFELISNEQLEEVSKLKRSLEGRSVALKGVRPVNDHTISLLAAAFDRSPEAELAVPYARL